MECQSIDIIFQMIHDDEDDDDDREEMTDEESEDESKSSFPCSFNSIQCNSISSAFLFHSIQFNPVTSPLLTLLS